MFEFRGDEIGGDAANKGHPPAIRPVWDALVLTDRPDFQWPADPEATAYELELSVAGSNDRAWKRRTTERRRTYPQDEPPLPRGPIKVFRWTLRSVLKDSGSSSRQLVGQFQVATSGRAEQLAKLKPLIESDDRADWLLSASALEAERVYDQALIIFERLVRDEANSPDLRLRLAGLHYQTGQTREFLADLDAVQKLGVEPPEVLRLRKEQLLLLRTFVAELARVQCPQVGLLANSATRCAVVLHPSA